MDPVIKILIAEHDDHDLEMIDAELKRGGFNFAGEIVQNESNYRKALKDFIPDIILSDYSFPSFSGLAAFSIREEITPETPFIMVSGTIGEENSIELIRNGLTDFVLKDKMFTLNTKLLRALKEAKERKEKNKAERELKQSEIRLIKAQAIARIGSWETSLIDLQVNWSEETYNIFGVDPHNFHATHTEFLQMIHPDDVEEVNIAFQTSFSRTTVNTVEHRIITPAGLLKHVEENWQISFDDMGKPLTAVGTCQDITERKKNEAVINKAHEEKNMVLESIDDVFFATDKNSLVTYWNRKAEILLDVKKEDMLGKNIHEIFTDRSSTIFYENYQKAIKENNTVRFEGFSERTNKWFAVSAFASDNGLSVYFKDVTEHKVADEKLKESELRYRSIIEQATDAICITDASMKIIDINPYGCQMLGYSKNEFLELAINDLLLQEDLAADPFKIEELRSGKVIRNERRFKCKDGTLIDVEMSGRILADGRFIVFGHDIAERKKAQDIIKESERRYRQIVETAQEGIWVIDENSKTTFVNDKMCEILEYTEPEMIGREIYFFMDEEGKQVAEGLMEMKKAGRSGQDHFKYISKSGKEVWTNLSANPLFDEKGIYKGSLGMVTDITENKKAEEKLRKVNRLYTFISQVNHNIVHIKDEAELFRNSCQVAFKFGKFKIAWIGIINKETEKITLVEQNGVADEDMPLFTDTSCQKNCPQDQVLRTVTYYLCNDVEHDPELQNWKPFAAKHGIRSVMVLPIKKSGQIIGTFNLYATELNFFDKEEVALLTAVTEDISFALNIFEKAKMQREVEELMLKNEKRFRALIEKSADMKTLSTVEGKLLYGSPSLTKFLGYEVDELLGKSAFDFIHPDDTMTEKIIQELFSTPGTSFRLQQRMLHKNGYWIWCEGSITNMLHEPGVNALVSNFRDISDRKIAEQQREFDRNNLNALINNTSDLMWSVDKNCKLITFNQPFYDTIRFVSGKELAKGDDVFSVVLSPDQYDKFKICYDRALSGEAFTEIEYIATPKEFWSEISFYPILNGSEVIGTACHSRDVTERIKAEKRDQFQATLLNTIGQAAIATDMQGKINFWNKAASTIYGWTEEEVLGKNILNITPSQQTKDQADEIMQELSLGNTWSGEFMVKRKDGSEFPAFVTNAPIYDKQQQLIGIMGVSTDITSRKRAELGLKKSNERYKRSEIQLKVLNANLQGQAKKLAISNAELEQFAYVASHDLQEPLRMVTSFLTQLQKKYGAVIDDKGKQYIEFAVDGARRMRQIILDLLEYSRVGSNYEHVEDIDLNELVEEIQILFSKQVEEKNAIITVDRLPGLLAHRSPIRQIFQNLVGNALKYTGENKPVKIHISVNSIKDHWEFAISDNGIGIDQEYYDKIFIIFQRLHSKEEFSGTGMGLAITKKIIESKGGKIWVESEEGKGSTFYFTMPKAIVIRKPEFVEQKNQ